MFEHLDPNDPFDMPPDARERVSAHVRRRTRRRRQRWALTAVLVVAAAVGVPLVLGALGRRSNTHLATAGKGPSVTGAPTTSTQPPSTAPSNQTAPPLTSMTKLTSVALTPDGQIWAIGHDADGQFALDRSTDGGATWRAVASPQLQALPASDDPQLRAAAGGRLWILTDRGNTIATMTDDGGAHWSTPHDAPRGIVDLRAAGASVWAIVNPCSSGSPSCTKVLMVSSDAGRTWSTPSTQPVTGSGAVPYLGTGLIRVTDEDAWIFTPTASGNVRPDGRDSGIVVSRTTDGGRSWQSLGEVPSFGTMASCQLADLAASKGVIWFLCGQQPSAGNEERTVLRSTTGGSTWTVAYQGFGFGYPTAIFPIDGQRAILSMARAPFARTIDGGRTWMPTALPGYDGDFTNLGLTCGDGGSCLAFTTSPESNRGPSVWRSSDGGATWSGPSQIVPAAPSGTGGTSTPTTL
jgi:hypothetical protein